MYLHIYIFGLYICIHIQPNVPCFCLNVKTVSGTRILVTGLTDSRIEKYNGLFGKVIQKCKKAANRVVVLIYCPIRSKNVKISLNIKNIKISIDNSEKIEQDRIHYDDSEIDKIREFAHNLNLKKKNEIEALSFSAKLQNCFRDFGDFFAEFKKNIAAIFVPICSKIGRIWLCCYGSRNINYGFGTRTSRFTEKRD